MKCLDKNDLMTRPCCVETRETDMVHKMYNAILILRDIVVYVR